MKRILALVLSLVLVFSFASCAKQQADTSNATTKETTVAAEEEKIVGELDVSFELSDKNEIKSNEVVDEANKVSKVVVTYIDGQTVGEALLAVKLIEGENGDYGLYVKTVNDITYDLDSVKAYWAFYIDDEYATTGVDGQKIESGKNYKLVVEKYE